MVRFIMQILGEPMGIPISFTFQYGQIYYCIFDVANSFIFPNLHSNMVRFIIDLIKLSRVFLIYIYIPIWLDLLFTYDPLYTEYDEKFTFQYGQIYYFHTIQAVNPQKSYLHSNMVRFIIHLFWYSIDINARIYIPIWLDLLQII